MEPPPLKWLLSLTVSRFLSGSVAHFGPAAHFVRILRSKPFAATSPSND